MRNKYLSFFGLPLVAALVAAGVAVAASSGPSVSSVRATFSATSVSNAHKVTCTPKKGGDTFQSSSATYKGTSESTDGRLNGTLKISAHSFLDTTTGLGKVSGVYSIVGKGKAGVTGKFVASLSNGAASGFARGTVKGPGGHLIAALGSSFDPANGFSGGSLGSVTAGSGVVVSNGVCPKKK